MKKLGVLLLGFVSALPLYAQDSGTPPPDASAPPSDSSAPPPSDATATPPADASATPPADASAAPADASATPPAEATPTAEAAPAETPAEAPPAETTATVEVAPAGEAPAPADSNPWIFYVGASYGSAKVSISNLEGFAATDTTTRMYQGRIGMRLTDGLGIEGHFGKGQDDDDTPNQAKLDQYYGIYFVPTGTLLNLVEFGFPLGFAWTKLKNGNASQSLDGVSYGMNVEFPFKLIADAIPDIRLVGGGMVYQQNNSARTYGWHAGLRFDFAVGGSAPAPEPVAEAAPPPPPAEEPPPPPPPPPPCQAPAPGQPANLEGCKGGETLVLQGVNFEFDKAALTVNAKTLLDQVADELNKHPGIKFEINGHTDNKGSDAYNQKLSEKRAASVKDYLASKNVDGSRMTTHGLGESMPIADNNTDEGRETNRRVELKVTESGSAAAETPAAPADASAPAPSEAAAPAAEAAAPAPEATAPAPEAAPAETPPAETPPQ